jgi:hypothetical protein
MTGHYSYEKYRWMVAEKIVERNYRKGKRSEKKMNYYHYCINIETFGTHS